MSIENSTNNEKELVLLKAPFLKKLLKSSESAEKRWEHIDIEAHSIRSQIEEQHGRNWENLTLRPLLALSEKMGLVNPELEPDINYKITIGLLYIGYELENINNLQSVIDDIYDMLKNDKFIWQPSLIIDQNRNYQKGKMDILVGQLLDQGMFLRKGPGYNKLGTPPYTKPHGNQLEEFIESLDLEGI